MRPIYERHVFVCENTRSPEDPRGDCARRGGAAVREAFKAAIEERGLGGMMRANKAGCLDQCKMGVTVVVYPDAVWYCHVTPADVPEIVENHLVGGRTVERLAFGRNELGRRVKLVPDAGR